MRAMVATRTDAPLTLSLSLVTYHNSLPQVETLLSSLAVAARHAAKQGLDVARLTVVDNSCSPVYAEKLRQLLTHRDWPIEATLVVNTCNDGFGAGHNQALPEEGSDVHLVLNPDVVLAPDALSQGLDYLQQQENVVLVSPRVTAPDGQQEFLCKRYPSVWVLFLRAFAPAWLRARYQQALSHYEYRDVCASDQAASIELASGCFMLVRSAALVDAGGFDERYFLYFEDFDLSLRLASAGELHYQPKVQITHAGGYAARKGLQHIRWFIAGGIRFFRQHGWRWI